MQPLTQALTAVVWLKRDLRLSDHAPLSHARHFERAVALYVVEPAWLASPEFAPQHVRFALAAVEALRCQGLPVLLRVGAMPDILARLQASIGFTHLLSHEETGPGWTYARDLAVAQWCRDAGVQWQEWPQTGVVRRLRSRAGWASRWDARMNAPLLPPVHGLAGAARRDGGVLSLGPDPAVLLQRLPPSADGPDTDPPVPRAGEEAGQAVLASFLSHRGRHYRQDISSPLTAEQGCSRLSAHLAFGSLSMRQVHQATEARVAALRERADQGDALARRFAHALRGFSGRLRWHCHFIQKLEDEPEIEFRNFARSCDGLRDEQLVAGADRQPQALHLAAWCQGQTGYPMVDACMRSLRATGWINFRMRAMLVSFAAYHLWLHWRAPGLFLARQFLDFEPGIHWSQMQMQSGTTSINTLRIYSPVKQAQDQDPQGHFIRRWVPELAAVPDSHLAAPWTLSNAEQRALGCVLGRDYPAPVVDPLAAPRAAKERLYGLRRDPATRAEASQIQARHGSRKSGLASHSRARPPTTRDPRAAAARSGGRRKPGDDGASVVAAPKQADLFD